VCIDQGIVTEVMLSEDTRQNYVRHDVFELFDRPPDLAPPASRHCTRPRSGPEGRKTGYNLTQINFRRLPSG
jgi:hypothetical protein